MASTLNVYGQFLGQAFDLDPGQEHNWIMWGSAADNGVIAWVSVKPFPGGFGFPGEKILAVTDFSSQANDDNTRRIFFTVRNVGANPILAYAMYVGWTDMI